MQNMFSRNNAQVTVLPFCDVGGNERNVEIPNKELKREVVNIGQILEYTQGIFKRIIGPIEENRFIKLRQIFQCFSQIFGNFRKIDQGK